MGYWMNRRNQYNKLKYRARLFRVPIDSDLDNCLTDMKNSTMAVNRLVTKLLAEYFDVEDPYSNSRYYRVITEDSLL